MLDGLVSGLIILMVLESTLLLSLLAR